MNANEENEKPVLPEWFNVFEGLTAEEIAEIDKVIAIRLNLTRPTPFLDDVDEALTINVVNLQ